jgi:hypothetical protein
MKQNKCGTTYGNKTTPIASYYSYPFKFSDIRKHYTKEDELYWFINAGNDLNPYKPKTKETRFCITTLTDFVDKISLVEIPMC